MILTYFSKSFKMATEEALLEQVPEEMSESPPSQENGHIAKKNSKFTVTPVRLHFEAESSSIPDPPLINEDANSEKHSRSPSPVPSSPKKLKISIPDLQVAQSSRSPHNSGDGGVGGGGDAGSGGESSYENTLTQNSITRLLSKKFRNFRKYSIDTRQRTIKEKPEYEEEVNQRPMKRIINKFESLDYEIFENSLYIDEMNKLKAMRIQYQWLVRWLVMFLIGVGTAVVAAIIDLAIEYSADYKFLAISKVIDMCDKSSPGCLAIPMLLWVGINVTVILFGALLVTFVEPMAIGSGIPQIKCYLNGVKMPGLLSLRALCAKAGGVIMSVIGGLACGKEGPMIHSGAIVAAGMSQGRSRVCNLDFKVFKYLRSDHERRDFVSGGAAAGVSAAFGSPLGGVLFSLEEGASFWNQSLTWRMLFASMTATFAVNLILSAVAGHVSNLSNPGLVSFGQFQDISYDMIEMPIFIVMAVFGGLTGALFVQINYKLSLFRKKYLSRPYMKILEAMLVASVCAVISFLLVYSIPACKTPYQENKEEEEHHREHVVKLFCNEGEYNSVSDIFFKTPEGSLKGMLHKPHDAYSPLSLVMFSVVYFLFTVWTYGLSVSSGVFIPALLTGAAWGRLVGMGVLYWLPHMVKSANLGKYALIGAAVQLGGIVRMTISLTVIVIECTGDITFGLPVMISLIIAKWVGDFFNPGLYDLHIQLMGIPFLPWEPPPMCNNIYARHVMSKPVETLSVDENLGHILDLLQSTDHNGYPVVEKTYSTNSPRKKRSYGKCRGLILRSQLILLVKDKIASSCAEENGNENKPNDTQPQKKLKLQHFLDAYPRVTPMDGYFSDDERDLRIDLRPYMNPTPHIIKDNFSLPKMFTIFRGLGLRHLIVVNDNNEVAGIVTRKDLAKYRVQNKKGTLNVIQLHVQDS